MKMFVVFITVVGFLSMMLVSSIVALINNEPVSVPFDFDQLPSQQIESVTKDFAVCGADGQTYAFYQAKGLGVEIACETKCPCTLPTTE